MERKHKAVYEAYKKSASSSASNLDLFLKPQDREKEDDRYGIKHPAQMQRSKWFVQNIVVGCSLPMSLVENQSFRQFVHDLDPKFTLPSRHHVSAALIPSLWDTKNAAVCNLLGQARSVSLTVDIWTDRVMHSYLAVTAHTFVDLSPRSCLVKFAVFGGSHTGVKIAEEMRKMIEEYGLVEKVCYVVSDNASNMKKAFEVMNAVRSIPNPDDTDDLQEEGDAFAVDDESLWQDLEEGEDSHVSMALEQQSVTRLSCFAHTMQLAVRDGVAKLASATGLLAKISKMANLVHQSAKFREALEQKFDSCGKSIPSTNATRWNSLHSQLKAVSELDQIKLGEVLREQSMANLVLTSREHASLCELVEILDPFSEATDLCQGEKYTTVGCIVPSIVSLHKHLRSMEQHSKHHRLMITALMESLYKRFGGLLTTLKFPNVSTSSTSGSRSPSGFSEDVYVIACALDPSYGTLWLDDHPGDVSTKNQLKDYITGKSQTINIL